MTVNPEFLRFYNATFEWIQDNYGYGDLVKYWRTVAPFVANDLKVLAAARGIQGCAKYWRTTLSEEGVDYTLMVHDKHCMELEIRDCKSLREIGTPCDNYCKHCDVIYRTILEPLGMKYEWEKTGSKSCRITVLSSWAEADKPKP